MDRDKDKHSLLACQRFCENEWERFKRSNPHWETDVSVVTYFRSVSRPEFPEITLYQNYVTFTVTVEGYIFTYPMPIELAALVLPFLITDALSEDVEEILYKYLEPFMENVPLPLRLIP